MKVETVAIENAKGEKVLINKSDYDESKHKLFQTVNSEKSTVKSSGRQPKA